MEIVEHAYTSDFTKKTLAQFGWADGDAIPADLGDLLLQIKEQSAPTTRTDVLIDMEKMTPEQVVAVKERLAAAKDFARKKKEQEELDKKTATMHPSVADAYRKMVQETPSIIDDRDTVVDAVVDDTTQTAPSPAQASAALSTVEKTEEKSVPSTLPIATFCPRCGWDMRQKFEVVPSDRDKEDFLSTLLGGSRFRKIYELFGGRVVVTFRSVLAEENKLIYRQLLQDQQNQVINTEAEWFVQLMDYRLACALDTIADNTGKVIASVPELDMAAGTKEKTALVDQLALINKNVLAQEATRRLVGMHLRQFQRLIEAIEAMALEPSFWNGIE